MFDAIGIVPGGKGGAADEDEDEDEDADEDEEEQVERVGSKVGMQWRGEKRQKRVLLATLHDDSTVVYYIMHDGIVKPRQN